MWTSNSSRTTRKGFTHHPNETLPWRDCTSTDKLHTTTPNAQLDADSQAMRTTRDYLRALLMFASFRITFDQLDACSTGSGKQSVSTVSKGSIHHNHHTERNTISSTETPPRQQTPDSTGTLFAAGSLKDVKRHRALSAVGQSKIHAATEAAQTPPKHGIVLCSLKGLKCHSDLREVDRNNIHGATT